MCQCLSTDASWKLRAISTSDVMKSDERNDSVGTFVRPAIGREPFLSFPRTGDNPVQWIQLLHALDQPDLTGWPLPSPLKVQMQKCDKCSREFCSPINYRRHIRVHRRSLNVDKESHKNRDLLGAFWDKLSLDEAREIVSFKDVNLEEVPGSSIIRELTSFVWKPRFVTLPQVYLKAGSALLDIIQVRPSRLPISSQELFSILDDASERTFLCAGTAESMQKYVFDGEAGKIGLEMKNIVACTGFLVEQKLVKAWVADKDVEALRCQKLLVEEEETAQKRQAELLEKRRQKKLRQKEQKLKEQANGEKAYLEDNLSEALGSPPAEISSGPAASESGSDILETLTEHASSFLEPFQPLITEEDADIVAQFGYCRDHADSGTSVNVECRTVQGIGRRHLATSRWQVPKSQRGRWNGFHTSQNPQILKLEPAQKRGALKDSKAAPVVNGNKVWTRKPKPKNDGESIKSRVEKEAVHQAEQNKNSEVMIGSIPVMLGNSTAQQQGVGLVEAQENCGTEHASSKTIGQEKPPKTDSHVHGGLNRSAVMLWRPVSRDETRGPMAIQNACGESRDAIIGKDNDETVASETFIGSCALDDNYEGLMDGSLLFPTHAAKAFLAGRWKEAISEDHVKVVISPESEPPRCPEAENDCQVLATSSDSQPQGICGYDSSSATGTVKPIGTKPERV